ncbi:hypothetical protein FKM82_017915 [Ascaphus truei]
MVRTAGDVPGDPRTRLQGHECFCLEFIVEMRVRPQFCILFLQKRSTLLLRTNLWQTEAQANCRKAVILLNQDLHFQN